jgi:F-type H+-transporting ATPase subunit delta
MIPQKLVSFLQLLCEKGRIEYFEDAKVTFLELYEDWKNILKVTVKSAVPLTESEKERLTNKLENVYKCSLRMEYVIDASLIGGVVIETEDKVIDGSVKNRLQQVKEVIKR